MNLAKDNKVTEYSNLGQAAKFEYAGSGIRLL